LRIDGSLRFVGLGGLYPFFILVGKLKACFSSVLIERDITVIRLTFLIDQTSHIDGLTRFKVFVLCIGQFLTTERFWSFLRLVLLIFLLVVLPLSVGIATVKQKFGITFFRIVLYRSRKFGSFGRSHTF